MSTQTYDIAIIGGGIVGLSTAMSLAARGYQKLIVVEAEAKLADHQTGHNSGVIHAGLYYKPGSLKAKNCVAGREALYDFCQQHNIPHDRCGKIVVATHQRELPALEELERRGKANGLEGIRRISGDELREFEPHVAGIEGLHVPQTGIVNYRRVAEKYAELVRTQGGQIETSRCVSEVRRVGGELVLTTNAGDVRCRHLIGCAGLQADRVAQMCGVNPGLRIVPFRGEYYQLIPERQSLVRNLIYPVPNPRLPFLGVHFTRMIDGGVEAGPNAVLALSRSGYRWRDISPRDLFSMASSLGFWRMSLRYWKIGIDEIHRSLSKRAFVTALQRLLPELRLQDVYRAGSGVRSQAIKPNGQMVDDFHIVQAVGMVHVLNAPSPAATSSISIGKSIADLAIENFDLHKAS